MEAQEIEQKIKELEEGYENTKQLIKEYENTNNELFKRARYLLIATNKDRAKQIKLLKEKMTQPQSESAKTFTERDLKDILKITKLGI